MVKIQQEVLNGIQSWRFLSAISFWDSELKTSPVSSSSGELENPEIEDLDADVEVDDLELVDENEAATASWAFTVASEAFVEAFNAIVRTRISSVSASVFAAEEKQS